jgi:hypothetical protein
MTYTDKFEVVVLDELTSNCKQMRGCGWITLPIADIGLAAAVTVFIISFSQWCLGVYIWCGSTHQLAKLINSSASMVFMAFIALGLSSIISAYRVFRSAIKILWYALSDVNSMVSMYVGHAGLDFSFFVECHLWNSCFLQLGFLVVLQEFSRQAF